MIIKGQKIQNRPTFEVRNPFSGEVVAEVPIATEDDILQAMNTSHACTAKLSIDDRRTILRKAVTKIQEQELALAELITSESGLSLRDTQYEIHRVVNVFSAAANAVENIEEDSSWRFADKSSKPKLKVITEPLDLVLAITPFNHPMNQVAHKVAPAIVAGTPMVLKPSEKTPLSAIRLFEILHEAGLPPGMMNIITTNNPEQFLNVTLSTKLAQLVMFTGSVKVGKYIAQKLTATGNELVRYVPELGGNAAFVVLEDADIDLAAGLALNAFANSGQRCTAIKRILLPERIADEFISKFLDLTKKITFGNPYDPAVTMGTVIDEPAAKIVQQRVNSALAIGANLLYGNIRNSALYSPTVLDRVDRKSELAVTETFGPVASIIRITDIDDAIDVINSVKYKLAAGVMTKNEMSAKYISNAIKVGQFNWNSYPGYRTEQAPFGGFGDSGNGAKEGIILAAEGMRRIRTFYQHE
ncbi:MAG: aldehyde dehydrogenase family protein [Chloroflexi bacterium]|nr:aldehyde dehydrogenase family protein [Chloroflexota bacterium]